MKIVFLLILSISQSIASDKIQIYLKWFHQYQFAGYYVALEKGFFKDEGLDVDLIERNPKEFPMDMVVQDTGRYAVSDSSVVLRYMKGEPVVLVAPIFQHSPLVFATLKTSGIRGPIELKDKKVMYQVGQDDATVMAMFNNVGLSKNDFIAVKHSFKIESLISGDVDAISVYATNQPYQLQKLGIDFRLIDPSNYGVDFYGDSLVTSRKEAAGYPERVRALRRAVIKGWKYAVTNLDESVEIVLKYTKKDPGLVEFEARETKKMILANLVDIGSVSLSRLERIGQQYKKFGQVSGEVNLDYLIFDKFIAHDPIKEFFEKWWQTIAFFFSLIMSSLGAYAFSISKKLSKQSDELNKVLKSKEQFLSKMTHELRTPVTGIIGMVEHLDEFNDCEPEVKEGIQTIGFSARILKDLVNDVLDFSKLDIKMFNLIEKDFSLNDMIMNLEKTYLQQAKGKGFKFSVVSSLEENTFIKGDEVRILQVFNNLISNAFKFTKRGEVKFVVNPEDLGDEIKFYFSVTDSGLGISEEDQKTLFDPYVQSEKTYNQAPEGTGLGLAILKELVELMKGEIKVTSIEGEGSIFSVDLTFKKGELIRKEAIKYDKIQNKNLRVLVIDDNIINLKVISSTLKRLGVLSIDTFDRAGKGIQSLEEKSYDLVLMDLIMPEMTGIEAIKIIRNHVDKRVRNQIIYVCSANYESFEGEYQDIGFNGILEKPIKADELKLVLSGLIVSDKAA